MKEFGVEKIYKSLKDDLDKLYSEYYYLELSEEEFDDLVINEIRLSNNYYEEDGYREYIINIVKRVLNKKTKMLLKSDNGLITTINSFCNYLTISNNYEDDLDELKKLCSFLENNDISINIDLCLEILSNYSINEIVKNIVERNIKSIQENKVEYIFHSESISSFVSAYCILNNIETYGYNEGASFNENYYTDSLKTYLYDISQSPLLTKEEEVELANRVQSGDKEAKKEFILHNLRLVVSIAKRYYIREIPFLDLIQEGNLGLMTAIEKYNPVLGVRFSSYATYWIKQAISRAVLSRSSPIKISYQMYGKLRTYRKKLNEVLTSFDYTPTIYELSEKMNLPVKQIEEYNFLLEKSVSLNSLVGEEEDTELGDFISNNEETPDEIIIEDNLKKDIDLAFEKARLTEREKLILKYRYGLDNIKTETLLNIGKMFNITHERVRQIELSALAKIRKSEEAVRILSEYSFNPEKDYKNLECFYHKKQRKYRPYYMIKK